MDGGAGGRRSIICETRIGVDSDGVIVVVVVVATVSVVSVISVVVVVVVVN